VTESGVVTLSGDVPNAKVLLQAQKIAQNTEHVKSVQNNLKVDAANASAM
jgi:osmotically-inducible protein OsmY